MVKKNESECVECVCFFCYCFEGFDDVVGRRETVFLCYRDYDMTAL